MFFRWEDKIYWNLKFYGNVGRFKMENTICRWIVYKSNYFKWDVQIINEFSIISRIWNYSISYIT